MQSGWCLVNTRTGGAVASNLEVADGLVSRLVGLQLRRELPRGSGLLLVPCAAVHTFFMRFPIDVIQLDGRGRVVVVRRDVPPWSTVEASPWTRAVLELPVGTADVAIGDVLRLHGLGVDAPELPDSVAFLTEGGAEAAPATSEWRKLVVLVMVGLLGYVNSLPAPFPPEGPGPMADHPAAVETWPPWGEAAHGRGPVAWSLTLNHAVGRMRPGGYHAVNLLLHVLAALVLFGVVRRTLASPRSPPHYRDAAPWLAFAVALLWLIHPLQTQSVTPILHRGVLLAGLFALLTLYCVLRGAGVTRGLGWYVGAALFCTLGALSTDGMAAVVVLVLVYDRVFLSASWSEPIRRRWGIYSVLGSIIAVLLRPTPERVASVAVSPDAVLHHLRLSLFPYPLCADYADWSPASAWRLPSLLAVLALLALTGWVLMRYPRLGFLGLSFFLLLAAAPDATETAAVAEQRAYLALAPLLVLAVLCGEAVIAWVGRRWSLTPELAAGLGGLLAFTVAVAFTALTIARNDDHCDSARLWGDAVAKRPGNYRAMTRLGDACYAADDLAQAEEHYRTAVHLRPDWLPARHNLGVTLLRAGRPSEAAEVLRSVLGSDDESPLAAAAVSLLGLALWASNDPTAATLCFREAATREPDVAGHRFGLALALHEMGRFDASAAELRHGLKMDPEYPELARQLAWSRATHPDARHRFALEGVFLARKAVLVRGERPEILEALAAAWAEAERFDDAARTAEKAAQAADAAGWSAVASRLRRQTEQYRRGQPLRDDSRSLMTDPRLKL